MRYRAQQHGFTLIEVLVATALFVMVTVAAVSALLVILDANRKAQNISTAINNAFFSIETMTRLLRTGTNYHATAYNHTLNPTAGDELDTNGYIKPRNRGNGASMIYFIDDRGRQNAIGYNSATKEIRRWIDTDGNNESYLGFNGQDTDGAPFEESYPITSVDFRVEEMAFDVSGAKPKNPPDDDEEQPTVTMVIKGTVRPGTPESTTIYIQTTVTQRLIDL